eukprot:3227045-Prymnesium_polylepis.1
MVTGAAAAAGAARSGGGRDSVVCAVTAAAMPRERRPARGAPKASCAPFGAPFGVPFGTRLRGAEAEELALTISQRKRTDGRRLHLRCHRAAAAPRDRRVATALGAAAAAARQVARGGRWERAGSLLSLIHISEPTRRS